MKRTEMQSTRILEREINCCGSGFNWVSGSELGIRIRAAQKTPQIILAWIRISIGSGLSNIPGSGFSENRSRFKTLMNTQQRRNIRYIQKDVICSHLGLVFFYVRLCAVKWTFHNIGWKTSEIPNLDIGSCYQTDSSTSTVYISIFLSSCLISVRYCVDTAPDRQKAKLNSSFARKFLNTV
jgi:hypothetical protein